MAARQMKSHHLRYLASSLCAFGLGGAFSACGDDHASGAPDGSVTPDARAAADAPTSPDGPANLSRHFTVRLENIAPWSLLKLSSARTKTTLIDGNLAPGEAYETRFTAAPGHRLSFAFMLLESNDWFFAPDPAGLPLFENGVPLSGDLTSRIKLWDAGTELDQEPGVGPDTGTRQSTSVSGAADGNPNLREVPASVVLADGSTFARPSVVSMVRVTLLPPDSDGVFTLRFQNVSTTSTLVTSAGTQSVHLSPVIWAIHRGPDALFTKNAPVPANGFVYLAESGQPDPLLDGLRFLRGVATPLSPGVFVIHRGDVPLFTVGASDSGRGLEALAEDGQPAALAVALAADPMVRSGVFDRPLGAPVAGPAMAGDAFELQFDAMPGDRLSFATMFGASNDWFFAPRPSGIELFLGPDARWGDVTSEVRLYDLGTESDQELDVGSSTATQQSAPGMGGTDSNALVRVVAPLLYDTPVAEHLRVTITPSAP